MEKVIPFRDCQHLLKEGDVLLFRANTLVGKCITAYTGGKHSHVGLAHQDTDSWFCVEQREFKGGRSVLLQPYARANPIDVYRVSPSIFIPRWDGNNVAWDRKVFTEKTASLVTDFGLQLTGSKYGWYNIWQIFKGYAPFFRLVYSPKNGDSAPAKAYVCSTVVTGAYRLAFMDLCPNLSDTRTTPADIAQSALLNYMFTIGD